MGVAREVVSTVSGKGPECPFKRDNCGNTSDVPVPPGYGVLSAEKKKKKNVKSEIRRGKRSDKIQKGLSLVFPVFKIQAAAICSKNSDLGREGTQVSRLFRLEAATKGVGCADS